MKNKYILTLLSMLLISTFNISAQSGTFNFDELTIDSGKTINGIDGYKLYQKADGGITLNMQVQYDTQYHYWSGGWAFSHIYDSTTTTSNAGKQLYASKGFKGYNNSKIFAVGTNGSVMDFDISSDQKPKTKVLDFYIASSTYAYNSITFGDAFGKKFGGASGTDKDFFKLKIWGYSNGNFIDSFVYLLADFTGSTKFKNSAWTLMRYSTKADSFVFDLSSSDNGSFGMNTPAYYTIDNVVYSTALNSKNIQGAANVKVWPNPASDAFMINAEAPIQAYRVTTISGQTVNITAETGTHQLYFNTRNIAAGIYTVQVKTAAGTSSVKVAITH